MQLLHSAYFGSKPIPIDFILDEQGEIGLDAQETWLLLKRLAERLAQAGRTDMRPCLGSMPRFENEKIFLPLQAADLYAWNLRRFFYENGRLILPPNSILKELSPIPSIHAFLGEREFLDLKFGRFGGLLKRQPWGVNLGSRLNLTKSR